MLSKNTLLRKLGWDTLGPQPPQQGLQSFLPKKRMVVSDSVWTTEASTTLPSKTNILYHSFRSFSKDSLRPSTSQNLISRMATIILGWPKERNGRQPSELDMDTLSTLSCPWDLPMLQPAFRSLSTTPSGNF